MFARPGIDPFFAPEVSPLRYGWELDGQVWSRGGTNVWDEEGARSERSEGCTGSA